VAFSRWPRQLAVHATSNGGAGYWSEHRACRDAVRAGNVAILRLRALPRTGGRVAVIFLAHRVGGVVVSVDENLRGLDVVTDEGETVRFKLSQATGRFVAPGHSDAQLYFDEP
jgi:hypothetical protein